MRKEIARNLWLSPWESSICKLSLAGDESCILTLYQLLYPSTLAGISGKFSISLHSQFYVRTLTNDPKGIGVKGTIFSMKQTQGYIWTSSHCGHPPALKPLTLRSPSFCSLSVYLGKKQSLLFLCNSSAFRICLPELMVAFDAHGFQDSNSKELTTYIEYVMSTTPVGSYAGTQLVH